MSISVFAPAISREREREKGTTCCCIYVVLDLMIQAMEEVLDDQPLFYAVVWTCFYVLLETLLDFQDGLIRQLLNSGDSVPEGIGLAYYKVLG